MFIKVNPMKPMIIGENLDSGPKKYVRLVPVHDNPKSRIATPTKSIPINWTIPVLFSSEILF